MLAKENICGKVSVFLIHSFTSEHVYVHNCIFFLYKGKDDTAVHPARPAAAAADEQNLHHQNQNAQSALSGPTKRVHVLDRHIKILPEMSVKKAKGKLLSSLSLVV